MNKNIRARVGALLLVALLLVQGVAAAGASTTTLVPAQTDIALAAGESTFTLDIVVNADYAFAGMELRMTPDAGITLDDTMTLLGTAQGAMSVNFTRDGVRYVGFFDGSNAFTATDEVMMRFTGTYSGSTSAQIAITGRQVVRLSDDGSTTVSEKFDDTLIVTITPAGSTGGTGGTGNNGNTGSTGNTGDTTEQPETPTEQPETPTTPSAMPFSDVSEADWYYAAVGYAYENGLFSGVSDTAFSPNGAMTRGMLVTVLHRMQGEPTATAASAFTDVAPDAWYAEAVAWAAENGIVEGMSDTSFAPDVVLTRAQVATVLYRYAAFLGLDTAIDDGGLFGFSDADTVPEWALSGMSWANQRGLITGLDSTTIAPSGQATRAQVATILMRFAALQ